MGRVISGKHSQSIEFNGELLLDRGTAKKKSPPKKSTSMPSICEDLKILKKERDTALKQVRFLFILFCINIASIFHCISESFSGHLPVCLSNITDLWLHRKLRGGFIHSREAN